MPTQYYLQCNKCEHAVRTSGLFGFSRDENSERIVIRHPGDKSLELHGNSAILYCSQCDNTFDIVLTEYNPPKNYLERYFKNCNTEVINHLVVCPTCHSERVYLSIDNDTYIKCPRCNEGMLRENSLFTMIS